MEVIKQMSTTVFRIKIETGNDAMCRVSDVKRALTKIRERLDAIDDSGEEKRILDDNGNAVGTVDFYLE